MGKQHHRSGRGYLVLGLATFALSGCPAPIEPDDGFGLDLETDSGTATTSVSSGGSSGEDSDDSATASMSTTATTAMTTSATSADSGDPECGAGICGVAAPEGWFGPTTWARIPGAGALPDCPAEYPEAGPTVLEGYNDPGPAICECSCEVDLAASCTSYTYDFGDAQCGAYLEFLQFTEDCHDFNVTAGTYFYMYQAGNPYCQASKSEEFPEVQWDASVRSCKLPDLPTPCGDEGVCTPPPPEGFEAGLCIYAQGDLECPAGAYATKYTYYAGAEDSRDCTNCTCGAALATCTGSMHVFDAGACGGNMVADVPSTGTCVATTGTSVGLNFTGESSCPVATPPEPMGTVAAMGEFTFCCGD